MRKAGWWVAASVAVGTIYNFQTHRAPPPAGEHVSSQAPVAADVASHSDESVAESVEPSPVTSSPDEHQGQAANEQDLSDDEQQSGDNQPALRKMIVTM